MMTKSTDDLSPHISEDTKQEIKNQIMAVADADIRANLLSKFHAGQYNLLLRFAVFYQQPTLVGVLFTTPLVNVNNRGTQSGDTALHIATRTGNLAMVKLLVAHSAYLDAVNAKGISSVLLALHEKQFEVAEYLLDQGAKLMLPNKEATPDLDEDDYTDSQKTLVTTSETQAKSWDKRDVSASQHYR